jgi:hypothetical protein
MSRSLDGHRRDVPLGPLFNGGEMETGEQEKMPEKCRQCQGCILCGEEHCLFNSRGNPEGCYVETCTYCFRFLRIQRIFLNNVG